MASTSESTQEVSCYEYRNVGSLTKEWVPFSKELLDRLVAEGKPVFIDFNCPLVSYLPNKPYGSLYLRK